MATQYVTIDLRTVKSIARAEKLKAKGWIIFSSSPDVIKMYRSKSPEK